MKGVYIELTDDLWVILHDTKQQTLRTYRSIVTEALRDVLHKYQMQMKAQYPLEEIAAK